MQYSANILLGDHSWRKTDLNEKKNNLNFEFKHLHRLTLSILSGVVQGSNGFMAKILATRLKADSSRYVSR